MKIIAKDLTHISVRVHLHIQRLPALEDDRRYLYLHTQEPPWPLKIRVMRALIDSAYFLEDTFMA